ncbi:MAG: pseudouridine synthase [Clostridiales bacterium]|nr:pseudouridine synthase [Clostridiales bacterium]
MEELIRLNKFISQTGYCSRRQADALIDAGKVKVNGKKPELGLKVSYKDEIIVEGTLITKKSEPVYLAFHKPVGITSTTDLKDPDNMIDFIGYPERIFHIGRLDKMSEGLIFLTNDGDIVNKILRAENGHEKEYIVTVDHAITEEFLVKMSKGVKILETVTLPCVVEQMGKRTFKIILTQGLNRQIRRMCEALGYKVIKLKRVRIMNIKLDGIAYGEWRYFSKKELNDINELVKTSQK